MLIFSKEVKKATPDEIKEIDKALGCTYSRLYNPWPYLALLILFAIASCMAMAVTYGDYKNTNEPASVVISEGCYTIETQTQCLDYKCGLNK